MSTIFIERTVNLNGPIIPDTLTGVLNCGEVDSHEFTISATLDNEPFALSGVVTANFIRSDGVTVPLTGSISDGAAVVVLSNLCYNVPGRFAFTVFITSEGVTTAIYGCTGTVRQTDSGSIVDPGEIIPSVSGLITAIENAIAAIPADYSQLLATQAPTFSTSTAYAAGSYVWYDGTLYRFTAAHAAGSWTGSDATAVTIGGELADLRSALPNYFAVSAGRATTIPDNSDINDYITPGTYKITNNTHAATMTNMPVKTAGKLFVIELSQARRLVQWYMITNTTTGSEFYQRYYDGAAWTTWQYYVRSEKFNTLVGRVNALDKKISVSYESGTWGDGTERLNIYVPTYTGYIFYRLYHYINTDSADKSYNCNCWQIANAYYVDDNKSNATQFTISGEWECAIKLAKNEVYPSSDPRNDFSGGHTHGDEILQSITVQLDGKPVNMSALATTTTCDELRIIRTSKMYDPENHITEIAEHGVEYVFNKSTGLTINQSLKWLVAEPLANCFMAMFLPSKNYIDRASANSDFAVLELPSSTGESLASIVKPNADKVDMWDTATGLSAVVSVPVYPKGLTGGDRLSISDNNGLDYNKVYFRVCSGHTSTIGELWKTTTVYNIDYSNPAT